MTLKMLRNGFRRLEEEYMNSVLVDTSFCIRLMKDTDDLHPNAVNYWEYFMRNKIEMYLSSIVIAEYSVKADPNLLPLKTMRVLTFDYFDGKKAGEFHNTILENRDNLVGLERALVKDDCKLIAQMHNKKIDAFVSSDNRAISKIFKPIESKLNLNLGFINFTKPLSEVLGQFEFPID